MVQINELLGYCDELLQAHAFADYCPNGLQVEGRREIGKLVTGVTASRRFIEAAIAARADALVVHHGYFWKGEDPRIVGMKAERLRLLTGEHLNLIAYHLPLDAHEALGNNVQLAERLGVVVDERVTAAGVPGLLLIGGLPDPLNVGELQSRLQRALGRGPVSVEGGSHAVRRVAICTGAGQRFIAQAAALGADAFISGEISEPTAHEARELGIHYFAAGHHATERYGVQALGEHLANRFALTHVFMDDDNPA